MKSDKVFSTRDEIDKYLDLLRERPLSCERDAPFCTVDDVPTLLEYSKNNSIKLGIVYQSTRHIFVVDLVRTKDGKLFPYERLIKTAHGNSVVVIPFHGKKMVLLRQFRHALGEYQYCFPRGFGEPDISPEDNARKEISEELCCDSDGYVFLGQTVADSGICGEKINVFKCDITAPKPKRFYEGIDSFTEVTQDEIHEMILHEMINDSFTLSAITLLNGRK